MPQEQDGLSFVKSESVSLPALTILPPCSRTSDALLRWRTGVRNGFAMLLDMMIYDSTPVVADSRKACGCVAFLAILELALLRLDILHERSQNVTNVRSKTSHRLNMPLFKEGLDQYLKYFGL